MRELKFRAWDKFNGEYWNSSHSKNLATFFNLIQDLKDGENEIIIEQYTGLKDKNGKEIYEGDVVIDRTDADEKAIGKSVVIFEYCSFCLAEFFKTNWSGDETSVNKYNHPLSEIGKYEIIGNIHNNPELIL